jgi:hypothetical protein
MAQDIKPRVRWRFTLMIAGLMCLAFIGIDWFHFFLFGTKFTYLINPLSATAALDFFIYLFVFGGMAFLIGFLVSFETKDVVVAGFLGPFLFLIMNYFIILGLLYVNPAYTTSLIPGWQWIWGFNPNWVAVLQDVIVGFTLLYLQSLILFLVLATPFILVLSFTGHAIRQMLGWNFPN